MASTEMIARLQGLSAGELKLLAQGFGQKPKNGAEAAEYLNALPDDQIVPALALLPAAPAASAPPPVLPTAEISPIPPASAGESSGTPADAAPADEAAALPRISTKNRMQVTYNGKVYVFGPNPAECTPLPRAVFEHYAAWLDREEVRFRAF